MIVLFTDFGADDIYVAQMKAVLHREAPPGTPVLDLLNSVPNFAVRAGAHLLAALCERFPPRSVFLAVVDPGVGSDRQAVVVEADGRWYVGPDNGLLSVLAARAAQVRVSRIVWRPARLSASFHGRDLFAPVAARLAGGHRTPNLLEPLARLEVDFGGADLPQIVHRDHYGNLLTGLRAGAVPRDAIIRAGTARMRWAETFARGEAGQPFWYENSVGLVEIATPNGSAAEMLGLQAGDSVAVATA